PRGTPGVHVRSAGDGTADDQFANGANQAGLIRFTGRTQDGLEPAKTPSLIQFSIRNALRALPTCPEMARWMPGTRRRRARDRGTRATPVREQGVDWNRSDVFHMNFSGWLLPAAEGLSKRYDKEMAATRTLGSPQRRVERQIVFFLGQPPPGVPALHQVHLDTSAAAAGALHHHPARTAAANNKVDG